MLIVADSSPFVVLISIAHVDLLPALFRQFAKGQGAQSPLHCQFVQLDGRSGSRDHSILSKRHVSS